MANADTNGEARRIASAHGVIVFDADLLPQATPALRDPAAWSHVTHLRGRGGRGGACVVEAEFGQGLLRHYRRGGLIGRWITDRYVYTGEAATRCLREFKLLRHLRELGLPVPRPVFAAWQRQGLFYRADLMTVLIASAQTLAECLQAGKAVDWSVVGAMLARFHRAGVFHADLNAHNILIDAADKLWLIDFDRGCLRTPAERWQQANLQRLQRSLHKLGHFDEAGWNTLKTAYQHGLNALGGR